MSRRSLRTSMSIFNSKRFENFKPDKKYSLDEISCIFNLDLKEFKIMFDKYYLKPKKPDSALLFVKDKQKDVRFKYKDEIIEMDSNQKNDFITLKIDNLWNDLTERKRNLF